MPSTDQQIAALVARVKALEAKANPALVTTQQLRQNTAMARGAYAGYGIAQNDNYQPEKNVDATHGLNVRYVVADNVQRLIQARLSIFLLPYETYDQPAAAAPHIHYRAWGAQTDAPAFYVSQNAGATRVASRQTGGGGTPPVIGFSTSTEHAVGASQAGADSTSESYDNNGHTHAQVLGVITGATATGVTLGVDGDDYTAALGGPFTANQVNLNLTSVLTTPGKTYLSKGAWHTITLTPSGLGRIEALIRFTYFADGSVPV